MRLRGLLTDRRQLVMALQAETGFTAEYKGAPSFRYQIGDYKVLRDGSVDVDEQKADRSILQRLAEQGLIEGQGEKPDGITFDASAFTGRTMVNLVNLFSAKELLINRAIGVPNAFHMKADLVRDLKAEAPTTMGEFYTVLCRHGGDRAMKGICLSKDQLVFTGFPDTNGCRALAGLIVHTAITSRWVKAKAQKSINDKYSFRVWLNSIGMKGPEYSAARSELLKNLSGDPSFRTPEQKTAFEERRRNSKQEPEFVLL